MEHGLIVCHNQPVFRARFAPESSSRIRKSSDLLPSALPLLGVSSPMQDSDDRNVWSSDRLLRRAASP